MFNPENAQNEIDFLNRSESKHLAWNSLSLQIPPTVYPPREDTTLLCDVLQSIKPYGTRSFLEIGSGSGALSIIAAKQGWNVHACDINPYAVAATRLNAQKASVEVEVREGGLGPAEEIHGLQAWNPGTYDLVVWNMPYIPADEINENVLGPLEEAALVDTHPEGLLSVFARTMAANKLCKMNGIALLVCRETIGWKRNVDILRQCGLAARIVRTKTFDDEEAIQVLAAWHPFVTSKHHHVREIDSTNAEMLRGKYSAGDSLTAIIQTSGRGRHGNQWQDHPNSFKGSWRIEESNIPNIDLKKQLEIAHEISHALRFDEQHSHQLGIKWPNDLLLRAKEQKLWKKYGGVLFQSYSKGDEQRLVLGVGLNIGEDKLSEGQGSLQQIGITNSLSDLFTILSATVASMFEERLPQLSAEYSTKIDTDIVLKKAFYRNQNCFLSSINENGIVLQDDEGKQHVVQDDEDVKWIDLSPQ